MDGPGDMTISRCMSQLVTVRLQQLPYSVNMTNAQPMSVGQNKYNICPEGSNKG